MIIGIPKEIKKAEFRVAATPGGVKTLCDAGYRVLVEKEAGEGSGFSDEEFQKSGQRLLRTRKNFLMRQNLSSR